MKPENIEKTNVLQWNPIEPAAHRNQPRHNFLYQSSLQPAEPGKNIRDFFIFLRNVFFWPINFFILPLQAYQILLHQIIFIAFLPIFLIIEVIGLFLDCLTCGQYSKERSSFFSQKKFSIGCPSASDCHQYKKYLKKFFLKDIPLDQKINLVHILNSFLSHANNYNADLYSKKNEKLEALIKVNVDGQSHIFKYFPGQSRERILWDYLHFIDGLVQPESMIKYTFVKIDYRYFLGTLQMEVKTDAVEYELTPEIEEQEPEQVSCFSAVTRFFFPRIRHIFSKKAAPVHIHKGTNEDLHFAFWPGFTRKKIVELVNHSLGNQELKEYDISLEDLHLFS